MEFVPLNSSKTFRRRSLPARSASVLHDFVLATGSLHGAAELGVVFDGDSWKVERITVETLAVLFSACRDCCFSLRFFMILFPSILTLQPRRRFRFTDRSDGGTHG